MKKLKLKSLDFSNSEILTRSQLKNLVAGGSVFGPNMPAGKCCWIYDNSVCGPCTTNPVCTALNWVQRIC